LEEREQRVSLSASISSSAKLGSLGFFSGLGAEGLEGTVVGVSLSEFVSVDMAVV
jgi:hypothetical protein